MTEKIDIGWADNLVQEDFITNLDVFNKLLKFVMFREKKLYIFELLITQP